MQNWLYLFPANKIALGIVIAQICLFSLWFVLLLAYRARCRRFIKEIEACRDVQPLSQYISDYENKSAPGDSSEIENRFRSYCANKVKKNSPVEKHLWAIFQTGFYNTQFDSSALIKGTVDEAFKINNTLRSILSIFIILGLLGTLFGLSSSLSEVAPLSTDNLQAVRESLKNLLDELKSAFAPSVWGVGFTIFGVLLFAIYHYRCNHFCSVLERETLTNWVMHLIRPPARTLIETIAKNQRQMEKNLEAAQKNNEASERFSESIKSVEEQTSAFQENMRNANETIVTFNESAGSLSRFSENFIKAAAKFAEFDAKIEQLFQNIQNKSDEFQNKILNSFNESQNFQTLINKNAEHQHKELRDVIQILQGKEQGYSEFRQNIDAGLKLLGKNLDEVSKEANNAFKSLGTRNQEIGNVLRAEIGASLKEEISEKLGDVTKELHSRLIEIYDSMNKLDKPFKDVANQLSGTYTNFDRGTQRLATDLKNEFIEQNRKNEESLANVQKLNPKIAELLDSLSKLSDFQAKQNNALAQNLGVLNDGVFRLSQQVSNLTVTIQNLPRTSPVAAAPVRWQAPQTVEKENPVEYKLNTAGDHTEPAHNAKEPEIKVKREYNRHFYRPHRQPDGLVSRLKRIVSFGRWK